MKNSGIEPGAVLGIDIGTTAISTVVIDIAQKRVANISTAENRFRLPTRHDLSEFDADRIVEVVRQLVQTQLQAYPNIACIGITGQMHGVVCVDKNGIAVSPFYNWQDGRAGRTFRAGATYCDEIAARTGYTVYPGYGLATLFYNCQNGLEPRNAVRFCSIMDYAAMALTDTAAPLVHPSNAAGFGLFDLQRGAFDRDAVQALGLSPQLLPEIAREGQPVGHCGTIPVFPAIGDNQASFFGSVRQDDRSALVNIGTGSQISMVVDAVRLVDKNLEIRPYVFGKYLLCGSALCGGKAYAIVERFFFRYAQAITDTPGAQYEIMNMLAQSAYAQPHRLNVQTQFCGTRAEPARRGAVTDIDDENFTPENLVLGVLRGMAEELRQYFDYMQPDHITNLVASGNAVQKNPVLLQLLRDVFGRAVALGDNEEEAAMGAACYAGISGGVLKPEQREQLIAYREDKTV